MSLMIETSWEYDDGLTMERKVYRHGRLTAVIPVEIIQDTPKMRPFKIGSAFGDLTHYPATKVAEEGK